MSAIIQTCIATHCTIGLVLFWIGRRKQPIKAVFSPHGIFCTGHLYATVFSLIVLQRWRDVSSVPYPVFFMGAVLFFPMFFGPYMLRSVRILNIFEWKKGTFLHFGHEDIEEIQHHMLNRLYMASVPYLRIVFGCMILVGVLVGVIGIAIRTISSEQRDQKMHADVVLFPVFGLFCVGVLGYLGWHIRKLQRIVSISNELLLLIVVYGIGGIVFIISQAVSSLDDEYFVGGSAVIIMQQFGFILSIWTPLMRVLVGGVEITTWDRVTLALGNTDVFLTLVLIDPHTRALFRQFVVSEAEGIDLVGVYQHLLSFRDVSSPRSRVSAARRVFTAMELSRYFLQQELCVMDQASKRAAPDAFEPWEKQVWDTLCVMMTRFRNSDQGLSIREQLAVFETSLRVAHTLGVFDGPVSPSMFRDLDSSHQDLFYTQREVHYFKRHTDEEDHDLGLQRDSHDEQRYHLDS